MKLNIKSFWNPKTTSKKNLTYSQAKKVYPKLKPYGDADKDGVINKKDCRPFNKKMQHSTKKKDSYDEVGERLDAYTDADEESRSDMTDYDDW